MWARHSAGLRAAMDWGMYDKDAMSRRQFSLRSHLILLVGATTIPLLVFAVAMIVLFARNERAALEDSVKDTARALMLATDAELDNSVKTLEALATSDYLDAPDLERFYRRVQRVLPTQRGWKTIILHDLSGNQLFNLLRPFAQPWQGRLAEADSFHKVLQTKKPAIINYTMGPLAGPSVGVRVPVLREGRVRYVLSAVIEPRLFADFLLKQKLPSDWVAAVYDQQKTILHRTHDSDNWVGKRADPLISQADPHATESWLKGSSRVDPSSYAAVSQSPLTGWSVAVFVRAAVVNAPLRRSVLYTVAVGAALLAVGVTLAWVVSQSTAGSIKALVKGAEDLGLGKTTTTVTTTTIDSPIHVAEVQELSQAFTRAAGLIQERSQALRESEGRLQLALAAGRMGAWEWNISNNQVTWSPGLEEIHGLKPGTFGGQFEDFKRDIHPEDVAPVLAEIERTLEACSDYHVVYRIQRPDGAVRWLETFGRMVLGGDGKPEKLVGVCMDITERKQAEEELGRLNAELEARVDERTAELLRNVEQREKLEEQLREAQKVEAIGMFAGGIAYDFNSILSTIVGYARQLRFGLESDQVQRSPEARTIIRRNSDAILQAGENGTNLVRQLLTFARKTSLSYQSVDPNALVHELEKDLKEELPKTIALRLSLEPDPPWVWGDHNQLQQVLSNICLNARDAMPDGGTLSIRTSKVPGSEVRARFRGAAAEAYLRIDVTDTGMGMSQETRRRIFEPFFTMKDLNGATGLGLTVAYGIVQGHSGFIDVKTEIGRGSTFSVYLPIRQAAEGRV
ncbi:MAG: PAS domain-containing protein [Deltaproteobacteria bacterium]|nr:PAS domain-containing protein [Deltaproteobacteria bacterium]